MKRCSQCNQAFTDDDLNFCLSDGTPLRIDNEAKTIVMQETTGEAEITHAKKRQVSAVAVAYWFYYFGGKRCHSWVLDLSLQRTRRERSSGTAKWCESFTSAGVDTHTDSYPDTHSSNEFLRLKSLPRSKQSSNVSWVSFRARRLEAGVQNLLGGNAWLSPHRRANRRRG